MHIPIKEMAHTGAKLLLGFYKKYVLFFLCYAQIRQALPINSPQLRVNKSDLLYSPVCVLPSDAPQISWIHISFVSSE